MDKDLLEILITELTDSDFFEIFNQKILKPGGFRIRNEQDVNKNRSLLERHALNFNNAKIMHKKFVMLAEKNKRKTNYDNWENLTSYCDDNGYLMSLIYFYATNRVDEFNTLLSHYKELNKEVSLSSIHEAHSPIDLEILKQELKGCQKRIKILEAKNKKESRDNEINIKKLESVKEELLKTISQQEIELLYYKKQDKEITELRNLNNSLNEKLKNLKVELHKTQEKEVVIKQDENKLFPAVQKVLLFGSIEGEFLKGFDGLIFDILDRFDPQVFEERVMDYDYIWFAEYELTQKEKVAISKLSISNTENNKVRKFQSIREINECKKYMNREGY